MRLLFTLALLAAGSCAVLVGCDAAEPDGPVITPLNTSYFPIEDTLVIVDPTVFPPIEAP